MPFDKELQDSFVYHCGDFNSKSLETIRGILDKHLEKGEISLTESGNSNGGSHPTDYQDAEYYTPIEAVFITMSRLVRTDCSSDLKNKCAFLLERGKDNDEFIDDALEKLAKIENAQSLHDVVKMLIEKIGVEKLEQNKDGNPRAIPLFVAAAKCHYMTEETIDFLNGKGANPNLKDLNNGKSIVHYAINHYGRPKHWELNKENIKKLVTEMEVDINAKDGKGFTPLHHIAARPNPTEKFQFMLELGANPDARQGGKRFGKKPVDLVMTGTDARKYKQAVRGVIEEHKDVEKEAKKQRKDEAGQGDKKTIAGTVKKAVTRVFGRRSSPAAGSGADLDAHRAGRSEGASPSVTAPNPNFKPGE